VWEMKTCLKYWYEELNGAIGKEMQLLMKERNNFKDVKEHILWQ
jgi:hypothetical protein